MASFPAYFSGSLLITDSPSEGIPEGTDGHRVLITHQAVRQALPSLVNTNLNATRDWTAHGTRGIGIITGAELLGATVIVRGVFLPQFSTVARELRYTLAGNPGAMGLSPEFEIGKIENKSAAVWRVTALRFTGAAIIWRDRAAFKRTAFRLV